MHYNIDFLIVIGSVKDIWRRSNYEDTNPERPCHWEHYQQSKIKYEAGMYPQETSLHYTSSPKQENTFFSNYFSLRKSPYIPTCMCRFSKFLLNDNRGTIGYKTTYCHSFILNLKYLRISFTIVFYRKIIARINFNLEYVLFAICKLF